MTRLIHSYKGILFLLVVTMFVIAGMFILNDINIYIRMKELRIVLQRIDRKESMLDHIGLVTRYNLNKRIYEKKITVDQADSIEFRLNLLAFKSNTYRSIQLQRYEYLAVPAIGAINLLRKITGKGPIRDLEEEGSISHLDIAYYYERNNLYEKALESYDEALKKDNPDTSIMAGIMLHQGFCHALIGNFEEAKELYLGIISNYRDENVVVTAMVLLRYLEGFYAEYRKVISSATDPIVKSEKLRKLFAYKEAIKIMEREEKNVPSSRWYEIVYYKGKCYEGMGETEKAVETYLNMIKENPRSRLAKLANRRLFIVGSRIGRDSDVKKASIRINHVLSDEVLANMMKEDGLTERERIANPEVKGVRVDSSLLKEVDELVRMISESYMDKIVEIDVLDGNIFKGMVVGENINNISLMTIIGKIDVPRDRINDIKVIK